MAEVACNIVRFVDDSFPRWVEARLVDADGTAWTFEDKVPIFTTGDLRSDTEYPVPAAIRCMVIETDVAAARTLIDTSQPDGVTSTDGTRTRFWVSSQLLKQ